MVCGFDLVRKNNTNSNTTYYPKAIIPPTMKISKVDSEGYFTMEFDQLMDVSKLIRQNVSERDKKKKEANSTNSTGLYLLSAKHIKISIKSTSDQDASKL